MESCSTLAECWVMKDANNLLQSGAAAAAAQQNSNLLERRTSPALWFSVSKVSSCCCPKTFAPKSGLPLLTLVTHISPAFDLFGAAFPALLANSGAASFESNLSRNAKLFRCKWHVQISLFDDAKIMIVIAKLSMLQLQTQPLQIGSHLGIFWETRGRKELKNIAAKNLGHPFSVSKLKGLWIWQLCQIYLRLLLDWIFASDPKKLSFLPLFPGFSK